MNRLVVVAASLLAAVTGCSDHKAKDGLAPAQDWNANTAGMVPVGGSGMVSPHANNPHAGMDMNNPHAGMDMGQGGTDVAKMGLPPPDPDRPIDPAHHVKGVIVVHPKAKEHTPPGGAVFVVVKKADASGQPAGPPLAVEKLTWGDKDQIPFELTEANAMIAGTQLVGDVVVTARYDHDGDALSKQPGDVVGQLRLTIPGDDVKVTLDQVLP